MKQNLIIITIFALCLGLLQYYRWSATEEAKKAQTYQQNNAILLKKLREVYNEKILLQQQNQQLESAAQQDAPTFDWYMDISHTAVIKQLQGS